ncbi:hypothetical protein LTR10_016143 [Elasticomyces elasticus]|uniref:glucan endo-1,3-beta-D-glucosidase n=1 Tax=Exophiala sideris TaxID=1016849 RepID=A0ABR0JF71_9EURO|nr:hypothetical protein LTR10_016143 [Elasticomyces elasticus]KAK5027589.1 hypothetical protein LTR13_009522 [Exophiala sideris]KAK5032849.1 hypothetical protein LTS07_004259 [Exophiala sideris]KAK5062373.1 hypothetical protein LTR69_004731 [Exophiala sideris]KAK5177531.1 hypothetical protein LTR44_009941 [Eurotiomycetes sp. CCFEE 6388]
MFNGRTFSFESHDEHSLHPQQQEQPPYDTRNTDTLPPPPPYASPPPHHQPDPASPPTSPRRRPVPPDTRLLSDLSPTRSDLRQQIPQDLDDIPPPPPPHRSSPNRLSREGSGFSQPYQPYLDVTPGMDNYVPQVPGGKRYSIGQGMADHNFGESGVEAIRSGPRSHSPYQSHSRDSSPYGQERPLSQLPQRNSFGSTFALAAGAATPGRVTPTGRPSPRPSAMSSSNIPIDHYASNLSLEMPYSDQRDGPYRTSHNTSFGAANIMNQASINPNNILDDGDDEPHNAQQQTSQPKSHGNLGPAVAAAGTGGVLAGLFGRKSRKYTPNGTYDAVGSNSKAEKSDWLAQQNQGKKRMRLWIGIAIVLVTVLAIAGGVVGGVLGSRSSKKSTSNSSSDTNNAAGDTAANGDLDKNSPEIQALMNNKDLHKVFPGMDYTPWGTQYPLCFTYPPSQNNVTRDMAVLSQLTNAVRLYGTDCNQTQMVLHAIDKLELTDMKVWMGVWIDTNQTTTDRQLQQMYEILANTTDLSIFKGVIVGNEALYRAGVDKTQSEQELIDILNEVRSNFSSKSYDLPIATSDLGDNWNAQLVTAVDYVMSNIHPFFAGVTPDVAASWTWEFWQTHDVVLTQGTSVKNLISETGWPSGGGEDCGGSTGACTAGQSGSVANVTGMNTFMDNWVCQALENGTEYFWFEAFDEPWKVIYNTATEQWEDKWGLMDPGRNLKPGLQIPDCNGKTVAS